jgi:hypothetical protein
MNHLENKFNTLCNTVSDINEHLPTLYKYATECESVIELGVRGCISSWALAYGLMCNNKPVKKILLNDLENCDINEFLRTTRELDIKVDYEWKNDLDLDIKENYDMVFIDTWHVYGQLKRELEKFSKVTNKYIIMHDTTVDEIYGESIRNGIQQKGLENQSLSSGIPVEEILKGLKPAIEEFLQKNSDWKLFVKYINNNGLTILRRTS